MELLLNRSIFTDKSTIGKLFVDGNPECYILEDMDRGLYSTMSIADLNKLKVWGVTCIPYGRYKILITKSARFSKMAGKDVYLPELIKVPVFEGVRIHKGNKPDDTEGCQLPGTVPKLNWVENSATAFLKLNDKINKALKAGDDCWITIQKEAINV